MNKYRYKIIKEIGKGSFGTVFKARQPKAKTDYAIKKVRCDAPENVELALQEFWTLSCLRQHDNIIRFEECYLQRGQLIRPMKHGDNSSREYLHLVEMAIKGKRGFDQEQYYLWFVMEYCDCGDMNDYILGRDPTAYLNTIFMMQLADGIAFLHKSNVVHRDLKPENVLVRSAKGKDPILKIADFGLSKVCTVPLKEVDTNQSEDDSEFNVDTCWLSSACGSDFFMAPEVFEGRYTAKADVFALGIIFWAIMDRITFIDAGTKKVLLGTYVRRDKEVLPVGEALLDDPNLDMGQLLADTGHGPVSGQRCKRSQSRTCISGNKGKLRDLIAQMVHPNPEFRPSSQELLGKLGSILQPGERRKNNGQPSSAVLFTAQKKRGRKSLPRNSAKSTPVKMLEPVQPTIKQEPEDIKEELSHFEDVPSNLIANVTGPKEEKSKVKQAKQKSLASNSVKKAKKKPQPSRRSLRLRKRPMTRSSSILLIPEIPKMGKSSSQKSRSKTVLRQASKAKQKVLTILQKSTKNETYDKDNATCEAVQGRDDALAPDTKPDISSEPKESAISCDQSSHNILIYDSKPAEVVKSSISSHSSVLDRRKLKHVPENNENKSARLEMEGLEILCNQESQIELEKTALKLKKYAGSPEKVLDPEAINGAASKNHIMFNGGIVTLNSDSDHVSSEVSVIKTVPELDSGYKSTRRSRRTSSASMTNKKECLKRTSSDKPTVDTMFGVSCLKKQDSDVQSSKHIKDPLRERALSKEEPKKHNFSPPLAGVTTEANPIVHISPFRRRHIGLKDQICKYKSSHQPINDVVPLVSNPNDITQLNCEKQQAEVGTSPSFKPNKVSETPKCRVEVPCTPCVVQQSKGGFRQNPFHAAVKKRWRYVVLEEPKDEETESKATNRDVSRKEFENCEKPIVVNATKSKHTEQSQKESGHIVHNVKPCEQCNTQHEPSCKSNDIITRVEQDNGTTNIEPYTSGKPLHSRKEFKSKCSLPDIGSPVKVTMMLPEKSEMKRQHHVAESVQSNIKKMRNTLQSDVTRQEALFQQTIRNRRSQFSGKHVTKIKPNIEQQKPVGNVTATQEQESNPIPKHPKYEARLDTALQHLANYWLPRDYSLNGQKKTANFRQSSYQRLKPEIKRVEKNTLQKINTDSRMSKERSHRVPVKFVDTTLPPTLPETSLVPQKETKPQTRQPRGQRASALYIPTIDLTNDDDDDEQDESRKRKCRDSHMSKVTPVSKMRRLENGYSRDDLRRKTHPTHHSRDSVIEFGAKDSIAPFPHGKTHPLVSPTRRDAQCARTSALKTTSTHRTQLKLRHEVPAHKIPIQGDISNVHMRSPPLCSPPLLSTDRRSEPVANFSSHSSNMGIMQVPTPRHEKIFPPRLHSPPFLTGYTRSPLSSPHDNKRCFSSDEILSSLALGSRVQSSQITSHPRLHLTERQSSSHFIPDPRLSQEEILMMHSEQLRSTKRGISNILSFTQNPHSASLGAELNAMLPQSMMHMARIGELCKNPSCVSCLALTELLTPMAGQQMYGSYQSVSPQLQRAMTSPIYRPTHYSSDPEQGVPLQDYPSRQHISGIVPAYPYQLQRRKTITNVP